MNRQSSERIDEQVHAIPSREGGRPKVKTKVTSMKRAFILFWHGLTGIITGIANWFTVILGMRDDSKYGKFIRRVVGGCFAFIMLLLAIAAGSAFCETLYDKLQGDRFFNDSYYDVQSLSNGVTYYSRYDTDGFVKTRDGKKTVTGISWIAKPLGNDSLVVFSKDNKRGYFNMYTGNEVVRPIYEHAWVFSDGLAAVDDNGCIKFIDSDGCVVIDPHVPYVCGFDGYVFHNGYCVVHDVHGTNVGLIDKTGKWVLRPEYVSIECCDSLWIVDNGRQNTVLSARLEIVMPLADAKYELLGNYIMATMKDHTVRKYDLDGKLIDDFYIYSVEKMVYDTDDIRYITTKKFDENGNVTGEETDAEPYRIQADAVCMKYQAEYNWYGLMAKDGRIVTLPLYDRITAIGKDLFLCECNGYGIIINGRGERVDTE